MVRPTAGRGSSKSREPKRQLNVESVTGAVCDDVPGQVEAAQGQVAEHVEHFVSRRFVNKSQAILDGTLRPENQ